MPQEVNLLLPAGDIHEKKPKKRRIYGKIIGIILGVFLLFAGGTVIYAGIVGYSGAKTIARELSLAEQSLRVFDTRALFHHIDTAAGAVEKTRQAMRPIGWVKVVPFIGPRFALIEQTMGISVRLATSVKKAADAGYEILEPIEDSRIIHAFRSGKNLTGEERRIILSAFLKNAGKLRGAADDFASAADDLNLIFKDELAIQFLGQLSGVSDTLSALAKSIRNIAPITELAPTILGHPHEATYLLLFQNNTEMRPTGGFIGVYGLLTVKDGEIIRFETDDIYALDGPSEKVDRIPPPEPIKKYIRINKWYLRDANWSPDFQVASDTILRFFEEEWRVAKNENPPHIDGIVAFTPNVIEDMLRVLGNITHSGKTFTPENLVEVLEFAVEQEFVTEGIPFHARKNIVGDLADIMIKKLENLPFDDLLQVANVVEENLNEKHIILFSRTKTVQDAILKNRWGGKVADSTRDSLLVVDANLAALKSDHAMERSIHYSFEPKEDGTFEGSVRVTYKHNGSFDYRTTRYRTYTRVYMPKGTTFLRATGAFADDALRDPSRRPGNIDIGEELGRSVFGAFTSVEPGKEHELTFFFRLAPSVVEDISTGQYELFAEKQAGTRGHRLTVDLNFGKKLLSANPGEAPFDWGDSVYRLDTDLERDRIMSVQLK